MLKTTIAFDPLFRKCLVTIITLIFVVSRKHFQ